jgi:hypothetical protein
MSSPVYATHEGIERLSSQPIEEHGGLPRAGRSGGWNLTDDTLDGGSLSIAAVRELSSMRDAGSDAARTARLVEALETIASGLPHREASNRRGPGRHHGVIRSRDASEIGLTQ